MCLSFEKLPQPHAVPSLSTSTLVWWKATPRWPFGAPGWPTAPEINKFSDCNVKFRAVLNREIIVSRTGADILWGAFSGWRTEAPQRKRKKPPSPKDSPEAGHIFLFRWG